MKDYCESKTVVKKVNGEDVTFHALPMGVLFKCRNLSDAVSKMLASFFADTSKDVRLEELTAPSKVEGTDKVFETKQATSMAVEPQIASLRLRHREDGIKSLVDALMGDKTQEILCEMIVRSARKEFVPEDAKTLLDKTDPDTFKQLLMGVLEANRGVFNGMGEFLSRLTKKDVMAGVKEKLTFLSPETPAI